jgi:hypothetical protein
MEIVNGHISLPPLEPLAWAPPLAACPLVSFAWLVRRRGFKSVRRSGWPSMDEMTSRSRGIGCIVRLWSPVRPGGARIEV